MNKTLTDRQRRIFEFIQDRIYNRGNAPTIREIGQQFGISSTNGVRTHLTALIAKGYLKKSEYLSRGLSLSRAAFHAFGRVPVVGAVPAGLPIDAIENVEDDIAIDASFLPKGETFSLRVTGESMKDAGIFDGDLVIVKKQRTAERNDIVVAMINGEATVKRYIPEGHKVRLQPANDAFDPIIVSKRSGDFQIAGKVVGLIRKF